MLLLSTYRAENHKALAKAAVASRQAKNSHPTAQSFISSLASFLLSLVLVLTIVSILGLPMTSLLTLLGSAGLSIGLALQGGFSNLTGGIIILMFKPFSIGDFIDDGTNQGTVKEINIFYTELTTRIIAALLYRTAQFLIRQS